jgi:hypothetical protein
MAMKTARYWSRDHAELTKNSGEQIRVVSRGWSDESVDRARAKAREIARRVAERIISHPGEKNQYGYGERPLPESVIREFARANAGPSAVVTRNAYGALVLNVDHMMFIDIDRQDRDEAGHNGAGASATSGLAELEQAAAALGLENVMSSIFSMFGGGKQAAPAPPAAPMPKPAPQTVSDSIRRVAERLGLSGRVYQTAAGHRVIITNRRFEAGKDESESILNQFGADRVYMRLCRTQESFRARLTPKPWRVDFRKPPVDFPYETPRAEADIRRWEAEYNQKCGSYATCRFVTSVGEDNIDPAFADLIAYHDEQTKANSGKPLA